MDIKQKIDKLEHIYRSLNKLTDGIEDSETKNQFILSLENLAIGTCRLKRLNKIKDKNPNQLELSVLSKIEKENEDDRFTFDTVLSSVLLWYFLFFSKNKSWHFRFNIIS